MDTAEVPTAKGDPAHSRSNCPVVDTYSRPAQEEEYYRALILGDRVLEILPEISSQTV
jgi:hypothetical protein